MTDAEVICEFMEPRPPDNTPQVRHGAAWWIWWNDRWVNVKLTLDACHEVEERLIAAPPANSDDGVTDWADRIDSALCDVMGAAIPMHYHWHATAEQKITALASVIGSAKP